MQLIHTCAKLYSEHSANILHNFYEIISVDKHINMRILRPTKQNSQYIFILYTHLHYHDQELFKNSINILSFHKLCKISFLVYRLRQTNNFRDCGTT